MPRYLVLRTCYSMGRLWEKGTEVDLEGVRVPDHFKQIKTLEEQIADRVAKELSLQESAGAGEAVSTKQEDGATEKIDQAAAADDADKGKLDNDAGLEGMNVFTLQKLAREAGLDLPATAKKEELIAALRGE